MVSVLSIVFMFFSCIVSFLLPLGLTVYFYKKRQIHLRAVLIGALVFFVFQILLRIPIISFISTLSWYSRVATWRWFPGILILPLFLALTAGLFEEIGRFFGYRFFLRERLSWWNGVAMGIGHGGTEALLLVGLGNLNNIVYSVLINSGQFGSQVAPVIPEGSAELIKYSLINTPSIMFLVGGLGRIMTLIIQIAFSLIVLIAIVRKKNIYLLYAVLLHTLIDLPAAFYQMGFLNLFTTEVMIFFLAIIAWVYIIRSKQNPYLASE